jgi:hypothetical protein
MKRLDTLVGLSDRLKIEMFTWSNEVGARSFPFKAMQSMADVTRQMTPVFSLLEMSE